MTIETLVALMDELEEARYCTSCGVVPLTVGHINYCDACLVAMIDWLEHEEQEKAQQTAYVQFTLDQKG